jgi:mannose-6-phosphate isomerase-like protein (cupin superfamily)
MADWSKKNFADIEDRSPADVTMQWRFARKELAFEELGVSRFTFEPDTRFPFAHRHREQEEADVVVAGSGRVKLDDEVVELAQWDVLRVPPAVGRQFEAGSEGLELICIGGRRPEGGDGEPVDDFWPD